VIKVISFVMSTTSGLRLKRFLTFSIAHPFARFKPFDINSLTISCESLYGSLYKWSDDYDKVVFVCPAVRTTYTASGVS
jgi:hypothetical protein